MNGLGGALSLTEHFVRHSLLPGSTMDPGYSSGARSEAKPHVSDLQDHRIQQCSRARGLIRPSAQCRRRQATNRQIADEAAEVAGASSRGLSRHTVPYALIAQPDLYAARLARAPEVDLNYVHYSNRGRLRKEAGPRLVLTT
jgi:hypothetical protein